MRQIEDPERLQALIGKPHPLTKQKIYSEIFPAAREFLEHTALVFLATADSKGELTVSPKGDASGFVHVVDEHTLIIPERPGNKLVHGLTNILETGKAGLIFLVPGTEETLRINGDCALFEDEELAQKLAANGRPALLLIQVTVRQCFFHCAKAFKRSRAWQPEDWQEPLKISFGKQIAAKVTNNKLGKAGVAAAVDQAVRSDYKKNL